MAASTKTTGESIIDALLKNVFASLPGSGIFCNGACPHDSCMLSILKGFYNGAYYGAKVRAPHALVMTFLFGKGSLQDKLRYIWTATFTHSKNLGCYVMLYKALACLMRHIRGKETGLNVAIAGFIGGMIMFGEKNPVNAQINMYVFSRICFGATNALIRHNYIEEKTWGYKLYASLTWAMVMYLFHYQQGTLQNSLAKSMTFLYNASDVHVKKL